MEPIILATAVLTGISAGILSKIGESVFDRLVQLVQKRLPESKTVKQLAVGETVDYKQAVIDLEPIVQNLEFQQLLEEIRSLLASNQELKAKVEALLPKAKGENIQVALEGFEAEELAGEIDQEVTKKDMESRTEQICVRNTKIAGKAVLKITQKIE